MANHVYPKLITALEKKGYDLSTESLKIVLLNSGYVYSASHQHLSDVDAGSRIATQPLASVTVGSVAEGTLDAADVTFPAVASGSTIVGYIVYDDTPSTEATKPLICFVDTDNASQAINVSTNGSDVSVVFSSSGIIAIS